MRIPSPEGSESLQHRKYDDSSPAGSLASFSLEDYADQQM